VFEYWFSLLLNGVRVLLASSLAVAEQVESGRARGER